MNEGRLPKPQGSPSHLVVEALRAYEYAWCDDLMRYGSRKHYRMLLTGMLPSMTPNEMAHYYAGVQRLLKGTK